MNSITKLQKIEDIIREHTPLLIAYSGGVDSSLLAGIAVSVLGKNQVRCVLVSGLEVPKRAVAEAVTTADLLGVTLEVIPGESLSPELKRIHPPDRCRHCKIGTFQILLKAAERYGCRFIADGANSSDLSEYRPGIEAFSSCGVIHPFIMADITKNEIREISRLKGFTFWDKPSSACLFSRIPYGEEITEEKVQMIEKGEEILKRLGFYQVRVRHHGTIARIEVLPEDIGKIIEKRLIIEEQIHEIGFSYVTFDLKGYRPGSMDEVTSGKLM
jgi:uncharacterized protein